MALKPMNHSRNLGQKVFLVFRWFFYVLVARSIFKHVVSLPNSDRNIFRQSSDRSAPKTREVRAVLGITLLLFLLDL